MQNSVQSSLNFEYMYSSQRARNLYSRHRDLTVGCQRQKKILDWERHTVVTQLDKDRARFTKRANKVFSKMLSSGPHGGSMPSLLPQGRRVQSAGDALARTRLETGSGISLPVRPATSTAELPGVESPPTSSTYTPHSPTPDLAKRSNVASAPAKSSRRATIATSSLLETPPTPSTYTPHSPTPDLIKRSNAPAKSSRRASIATSSLLHSQRSTPTSPGRMRRPSLFQLRQERLNSFASMHEEVHEQNQMLQSKVKQFIDDLEDYKEEFRQSLSPKREPTPEVTEVDVTAAETPNKQAGLSRTFKLRTPFSMSASATRLKDNVTVLEDQEHPTLKRKDISAVRQAGKQDLSGVKKAEQGLKSCREQQSAQGNKKSVDFIDELKELKSPQTKARPASKQSIGNPPRSESPSSTKKELKVEKNESELHPNHSVMLEAWEAYAKDVNLDNMRRLTAFAAKHKFNVRKARDKSTVPFIAARKAMKAFKNMVTRSKRKQASLEKGELPEGEDLDTSE